MGLLLGLQRADSLKADLSSHDFPPYQPRSLRVFRITSTANGNDVLNNIKVLTLFEQ